ncbi:hypothetical protein BV22DRAFT_1037747 [Leucogyrophana mollusca]|uniref:Uncharacterized protein n=1 Tax=Leucogyrophana mollusca TaxID=85980 RepID=A0ACB8B8T8_9AGAM|nr:hypothetical protein BV22DRAFT_1037747 [Leucogyrophana mollusca]
MSTDRDLTSISVSALSFLSWEICITFKDEVELIWSKPATSLVKWLFLLARYVGLASLLYVLIPDIQQFVEIAMGVCLFSATRLLGVYVGGSTIGCKGLLVLRVTMSQVLVTLIELIFMLRVHALYNRDRRMAVCLGFLAVSGMIVAIVGLSHTVANTQFDEMCSVTHIDSSMAYFGFAFVFIEGILLLLTILRCIHTFRASKKLAPIVTLMLRDGTLGFLALIAVLMPTSILLVVWHGAQLSFITPWFCAVLSCAGCRMIISLQRLPLYDRHDLTADQTLPVITSHILIEPPHPNS